MKGEHAADDGSFGRSAGGAMARGLVLIAVAVVLGLVLLRATDNSQTFVAAEDDRRSDDSSVDDEEDGDGDVAIPETTTTTEAPRDPSEVVVLVANGSGQAGVAATLSQELQTANYVTADPTDTSEPASASIVYFEPGFEADADAVAALFDPVPEVQALPDPLPVDDLRGANLLLVAAADLA